MNFLWALKASAATLSASSPVNSLGPATYTVPGPFPTSVFTKYYNSPTATFEQPQPVISDSVLHKLFPLNLTNPASIPTNDTIDPHPLPPKASSSALLHNAFNQVLSIATNPIFGNDTCARCIAALEVGKFLSMAAPEKGPELAVLLCEHFNFNGDCPTTFSHLAIGSVLTQVVANADVGGYDGQMLCQNFFSLCPLPPPSPLNLTEWFSKPKPNPLPPPKASKGKKLQVLHISDLHLDPRYSTGSEANCTSGTCCRANNPNVPNPDEAVFPAPRYGAFRCDTPLSLTAAALEAIPVMTGTEKTGFDAVLFTGDIASHDPDNQLSRDYVMYIETLAFDLFKEILGGPVYTTLGNHDSYNQAQDAPHTLGPPLADQFSWNYDHLAGLWEKEGWLPSESIELARAHYSAYMVKRADGLRVISLNTDMWYRANFFNYINMTNSDNSGMLRFLTDELQDAEDAGDRVWIIGHVLSGWDGSNPLENPTNLFYQIFSPHVIANIFFGHTHEDQFTVFYSNNGTVRSAETAQTVAWIGPSLTPITNLNSGFRMYEVDSETFEVLDAHTWYSDVSTFPSLDSQLEFGPTYNYEYNTRETYGDSIPNWQPNDPLNSTWWHLVTEAMEKDASLVTTFTALQGKNSVNTPPCTGACVEAKICYMRSGSTSLGKQCPQGFGSVQ